MEKMTTDTHQIETENQETWTDEELMNYDSDTEAEEDVVEEETTEEAVVEEEAVTETAEEEPVFYTDEELAQLDPYHVDPDKLPESAKVVHKKYLDIFNNSILPELQQLRAFRQKVENDIQAAQARINPREAFVKEVQNRAMRELGVTELDELNQEHVIELSRQATLVTQEINERTRNSQAQQNRQVQIKEIHQRLIDDFPDFDTLDVYARDELNNLPYIKAEKVKADIMSGDYGRIKSVFDMFKQRKEAKNKPPVKKAPSAPPKVITGSTSQNDVKSFDLDEWSKSNSETQAKMLLGAGLLD
ncbi:MAG: hypothetical protein EOM40_19750 [Clostridia bacterium]|nr:hypothetical protein [Clostridia bacterium]